MLRNSKFFNDIDTIVTLFTALVRSKLEYACVIWAPTSEFLCKKIERVQARFVRALFFKMFGFYPCYPEAISYSQLREQLCLESLEARRDKAKLLFIYNIINNNITCPGFIEKITIKTPRVTLRNRRNQNVNNRDTEYFRLPNRIKPVYLESPLMSTMKTFNKYSLQLDLDMNINVYKTACTALFDEENS